MLILFVLVMALSIGVIIYNLFANYRQKEYLKKYEIFKNGVTAYLGGNLSKDALHELVLENQEYLIELLAQLTQATSKANRHQLIDLLVACESTSVIDKELHQLQFGNWHERLNAATYLPFIAHAKTIEKPLLASLEDEFLDVRIAAANSLAQLGVIEAIHPILAHLAIEGAWPVQRLIEILSQFDIHAIPHLKSYITEPQASQPGRQIAIAVLGLIKDEASVSFLVSLCTDGDVDIRVWLYRSLGQLGYTSALPQLLMGMEDIAWEVRATCAKSLKHFEGEQSISALQKGISDPVWFVRLNCATSLIAMGMPGRLALEKLHDSPDHFVRDMSQMVLSQNINKEML